VERIVFVLVERDTFGTERVDEFRLRFDRTADKSCEEFLLGDSSPGLQPNLRPKTFEPRFRLVIDLYGCGHTE